MILVRSIVVLAICIIGICVRAWEIDTDKSTKNPLLVDLGQNFSLQCTVKEPDPDAQNDWKICTWSRQNDTSQCVFTYKWLAFDDKFEIQEDCNDAMIDAAFVGSENIQEHNIVCGMKFEEANEDDIVGWTCDIEQCASVGCKGTVGSGTIANATIYLVVRHYVFQITIFFKIICTICIQYCLFDKTNDFLVSLTALD